MYAWIIDKDHLASAGSSGEAGIIGPRDVSDEIVSHLQDINRPDLPNSALRTFRFRIYDDDGILYYSGRMITDEGQTEEACYGPLGDFGAPNAGATEIKYIGHPEMDCG